MPPPLEKNVWCPLSVAVLILLSDATAPAATLDEYRSLIADCRRTVQQKKVPEVSVQNLSSRLSAIETVTYPGGSSVKVNTRPLVTALQRLSEDGKAKGRFATLEGLLTSAGTMPASGDPQAQAQKVLAGKDFAELNKPVKPVKSVIPDWWVRFSRWADKTAERFTKWLSDLFRDRQPGIQPNPVGVEAFVRFLQFLLYFLLSVAVLVVLYLLARTAAARGWLGALRKRRKRDGDSGLDLDLSGNDIPDPLGAARSLAEQGAFREAVRMAYIASLRRLQENGLLVLEANKTNWEYQRDLRRRSRAAADTLLPATRLFDRVWYGRRNGTAADFSDAVRVHDALELIAADSFRASEETMAISGNEGQP